MSTSWMHSTASADHSNLAHFLVIHWEILLLQILNSWFMAIRFDHFLNSSWKWPLSWSFLFGIRSHLLSAHFWTQTWVLLTVFSHVVWWNLCLCWLMYHIWFGGLVSTLWWTRFTSTFYRALMDLVLLWLILLAIGVVGSHSLISWILHSLSIYLCFWSLMQILLLWNIWILLSKKLIFKTHLSLLCISSLSSTNLCWSFYLLCMVRKIGWINIINTIYV